MVQPLIDDAILPIIDGSPPWVDKMVVLVVVAVKEEVHGRAKMSREK